jgi:hypothetical protein
MSFVITQGWTQSGASLIVQGYQLNVSLLAGDGLTCDDGTSAPVSHYDTFTNSAGTPLASHTPDTGGSWTRHPSYVGSAVITDANTARSDTSQASVYYNTIAAPTTSDYEVSVDINVVGSPVNAWVGPAGRISPASDTYYSAVYDAFLEVFKLRKTVAGTLTTLATGVATLGDGRRVTLRMRGTSIALLVDGQVDCQAIDAAIAEAGRPGLYFNGLATNTLGLHVDQWQFRDGVGRGAFEWVTTLTFGSDGGGVAEPAKYWLASVVVDVAALNEAWSEWASTWAVEAGTPRELAAGAASTYGHDQATGDGVDQSASVATNTGPIITQGLGFNHALVVTQGYQANIASSSSDIGVDWGRVTDIQWIVGHTIALDSAGGAEDRGATSHDDLLLTVDTAQVAATEWLFRASFASDGLSSPDRATVHAVSFGADRPQGLEPAFLSKTLFAADASTEAAWSASVLSMFAADAVDAADAWAGVVASALAIDAGRAIDWSPFLSSFQYRVYANSGSADPIDYASFIASVGGLSYSLPIAHPGAYRFAVRVYDPVVDLEEKNLDARVDVVIDGFYRDVTNRPEAPAGLQASALAGGRLRVQWICRPPAAGKRPTGFRVYTGVGAPDYSNPATTVPFSTPGPYLVNLDGFSNGVGYGVAVRAFNAAGEESNTTSVTITADGTGPGPIDGLTLTPSSDSPY